MAKRKEGFITLEEVNFLCSIKPEMFFVPQNYQAEKKAWYDRVEHKDVFTNPNFTYSNYYISALLESSQKISNIEMRIRNLIPNCQDQNFAFLLTILLSRLTEIFNLVTDVGNLQGGNTSAYISSLNKKIFGDSSPDDVILAAKKFELKRCSGSYDSKLHLVTPKIDCDSIFDTDALEMALESSLMQYDLPIWKICRQSAGECGFKRIIDPMEDSINLMSKTLLRRQELTNALCQIVGGRILLYENAYQVIDFLDNKNRFPEKLRRFMIAGLDESRLYAAELLSSVKNCYSEGSRANGLDISVKGVYAAWMAHNGASFADVASMIYEDTQDIDLAWMHAYCAFGGLASNHFDFSEFVQCLTCIQETQGFYEFYKILEGDTYFVKDLSFGVFTPSLQKRLSDMQISPKYQIGTDSLYAEIRKSLLQFK